MLVMRSRRRRLQMMMARHLYTCNIVSNIMEFRVMLHICQHRTAIDKTDIHCRYTNSGVLFIVNSGVLFIVNSGVLFRVNSGVLFKVNSGVLFQLFS